MKQKYISPLDPADLNDALELCWSSFAETVAFRCSDEGVREFYALCDPEFMSHRMADGTVMFWGAFEDDRLVGVCAVREQCQIILLFVAGDRQNCGIGTSLMKAMVMDLKAAGQEVDRLSVEAAITAYPFFQKMGFAPVGDLDYSSGIPSVPMELKSLDGSQADG